MKRITPIFFLLTVLLATQSYAKILRVNNTLPLDQVDYNQIQDAVDNASNGDTIYVEGSATPYEGGIEIVKPLVIIGPGYLLKQSHLLPINCNSLDAVVTGNPTITIKSGADQTVIAGLTFDCCFNGKSILFDGNITNITITRNRLEDIEFTPGSQVDTLSVSRNLFKYGVYFGRAIVKNFRIINNLISDGISFDVAYGELMNGLIQNNTMESSSVVEVEGSIIRDNFIGIIESSTSNINIYNNMLWNETSPDNTEIKNEYPNNELRNYEFDNDFPPSWDNDLWKLLQTYERPMMGAYKGIDPIYNENPVSPSNLPAIPVIYDCNVASYGDSTINVTLKVRTNK